MRIILIGQAAFGASVLEAMLKKGENVIAVYAPPDTPGGKPDPLKQMAVVKDIPVHQHARMRNREVIEEYKKLQPDLGVMAFVTDIVPLVILECPRLGTIQYHPSLLPKHRGGSAMNWPIMKGETKTGLTIFWPDDGLDTGPILMQKEVEITPDDTLGTLYFGKLFQMGVDALMKSIDLVLQGKAPRIPQDESLATYEGLCGEENAVIDWQKPVRQVYNLVRGTNPSPGANTLLRGKKFKIYDCEPIIQDTVAVPGEIVEIADKGFTVACQGGCLLVKRVQAAGSPKLSAAEYAQTAGLKVRDKLG
ncbi:MAG: methionyl-tRNA formyltransferase [Dehalococcoidia bacterium]